jgi:hypothetical protein
MTMQETRFIYELGKFISEVKMDGYTTTDIERYIEQFIEEKSNEVWTDDAINFLSQAIQIQNGFILGIYDSLNTTQKDNASLVCQDVVELYKQVEKELNWAPLTKEMVS